MRSRPSLRLTTTAAAVFLMLLVTAVSGCTSDRDRADAQEVDRIERAMQRQPGVLRAHAFHRDETLAVPIVTGFRIVVDPAVGEEHAKSLANEAVRLIWTSRIFSVHAIRVTVWPKGRSYAPYLDESYYTREHILRIRRQHGPRPEGTYSVLS